MSTELAPIRKPPAEALAKLEQVVIRGDLSVLSESERIAYYARVAESLGLNPLTKPFEYIELNRKLTLYVRKEATDQLRDIHGVSVDNIERERDDEHGIYTVTTYVHDRYGRQDSDIGVVSIKGLTGENLANAMMKAQTKSKRRATLSICGLGWMDEIEALDARSVEVAPRQAAASAIASRTAALLGGADGESDGGDVTVSTSARAKASEAAGQAAGAPSGAGSPTEEVGPFQAALNESKPRTRARKALKEGDTGYGSARAHALAAERGLDHEAVRRIAMDVLGAEDPATFSLSQLPEPMWGEVIAAISEAPVGDDAVSAWAGTQARVALDIEGDDVWPVVDSEACEMLSVQEPDELTVAQWREFGIRIAARNSLP